MRVRRKALFALGVLFLLAAIGLPDVPAFTIWQRPGRQSLAALTLWCHTLQARMLVAVFHLAARRCTRPAPWTTWPCWSLSVASC